MGITIKQRDRVMMKTMATHIAEAAVLEILPGMMETAEMQPMM